MHARRWRWVGLVSALWLGGCAGSNNLQALLKSFPLPSPPETGGLMAPTGPHESVLTVSGTPTGVFAQVARGALGCWFGADGPLKVSHIFRAEANPPSEGGDAAIVLYERDPSQRDQRGAHVYRASFTRVGLRVRVVTVARRLDWKRAEAMAQDVAGWARGGKGCRLREVAPPAPAVSVKQGVEKGRKHAVARNKR